MSATETYNEKVKDSYSFKETQNSAGNLGKTFTEKSWDSSVGVEGYELENFDYTFGTDIGSGRYEDAGKDLINTGANLAAGVVDVTGDLLGALDPEQYGAVADAATAAALDFVNKKIERLREAWTTPATVTVKALLEEVSPYATDFNTAFNKMISKATSLVGYLTGAQGDSWTELAKSLGDQALNSMINDPKVIESASNLKAVQAFAKSATYITNAINSASKIVKKIEPLLPLLEITADFALSYFSGSTSTQKGLNKLLELGSVWAQKALAIVFESVRKYVYNIKIKVPSLLVGAMNSISVRDAVAGYSTDNKWLKAIFSDDFYATTMNSMVWQSSINNALDKVNSTLTSVQNTVTSVPYAGSLLRSSANLYSSRNPIEQIDVWQEGYTWQNYGDELLKRFKSSFTEEFMNAVVENAKRAAGLWNSMAFFWRKSAGHDETDSTGDEEGSRGLKTYDSELDKAIDHNNLSQSPLSEANLEESILNTSANIYESIAANSLAGDYYNFSIHKMVVDYLQEDGCACNSSGKEYDVETTFAGGYGSRKSFKQFNDKIILYHKLLKTLTGEQRANIREAIPVIDFFHNENTSILSTYENDGVFVDPTTILPIPAEPFATYPPLDYILNEDPYIINRAVMNEGMATHFWNTSAPTAQDANLQVSPWQNTEGSSAYIYKGVIANAVILDGQLTESYRVCDCYAISQERVYIEFNPVGDLPTEESREGEEILNVTRKDGLCYETGSDGVYYLDIEANDVAFILPKTSTSRENTKIIIFKSPDPLPPNFWSLSEAERQAKLDELQAAAEVNNGFIPYIVEVSTFTSSEPLTPTSPNDALPDIIQNPIIQRIMSKYIIFEKEYYADASGLLCGLYCEPKEVEEEQLFSGVTVSKWKFVGDMEEAAARGVLIDVGTKYFSGHLLGRGLIKASPFATTESDVVPSGVTGKATLIFNKVNTAVNSLLNPYLGLSKNEWLQNVEIPHLGCLTTKTDYNGSLVREPEQEDLLGEKRSNQTILKWENKLKAGSGESGELLVEDIINYFEACADCIKPYSGAKIWVPADDKNVDYRSYYNQEGSWEDAPAGQEYYQLTLDLDNDYVCYRKNINVNTGIFDWGWAKEDQEVVPAAGPYNTINSEFKKLFYIEYRERWKKKKKKRLSNFNDLSIKVASPIQVFDKISGFGSHDTILIYPEYSKYFPSDLFLLSKKDLHLDSSTNSLCSFYNKDEGKVICFRVEKVTKFLLSKVAKITIKESENEKTEKTLESTRSLWGFSWFRDIPDCYIYYLAPVELKINLEGIHDWEDRELDSSTLGAVDLIPMAYCIGDQSHETYFPVTSFTAPSGELKYMIESGDHRTRDLKTLANSYIIPGLPRVNSYSEYSQISQNNISLDIFSKFFNIGLDAIKKTLLKKAVSYILSEWPLSTSETNPIKFKDLENILLGLEEMSTALKQLTEAGFTVPVSHVKYEIGTDGNIYILGSGTLTEDGPKVTLYKKGSQYFTEPSSSSEEQHPLTFEVEEESEVVEVSEEDFDRLIDLINQSKYVSLNNYQTNLTSTEVPASSTSLGSSIDAKVNVGILPPNKIEEQDWRSSLSELRQIYSDALSSNGKIDETTCTALDRALGNNTLPFLKFGGSLSLEDSNEALKIPECVETVTQLVYERIVQYILKADVEIKEAAYNRLLEEDEVTGKAFEKYKISATQKMLKFELYKKYHNGVFPSSSLPQGVTNPEPLDGSWYVISYTRTFSCSTRTWQAEYAGRVTLDENNVPRAVAGKTYYTSIDVSTIVENISEGDDVSEYFVKDVPDYIVYPAGKVYRYESREYCKKKESGEGYRKARSDEQLPAFVKTAPVLSKMLENVSPTYEEQVYVKANGIRLCGIKALFWWAQSIPTLCRKSAYVNAVYDKTREVVTNEFNKIKAGVYNGRVSSYFENTEEFSLPTPIYLKDTEADSDGNIKAITDFYDILDNISIVKSDTGSDFTVKIRYPEYDLSSGATDQDLIVCTTLKRDVNDKCWTFKFENVEVAPNVSLDLLKGIASFIKTCLEGTGNDSYYVKYTVGDSAVSGRKNSLYYKRYVMLNNRLNKTKGPLSQAARYLLNKDEMAKIMEYDETRIESFEDYIEVVPVNSMEELTYLPSQEASASTIPLEGKFYNQKLLNSISSEINSKCALTCKRCTVNKSCPFYREEEVVKLYVPELETVDLWIKDNELDLIYYEYDEDGNIVSPKLTCTETLPNEAGTVETTLGAEEFINIHKPYADIRTKEDGTVEIGTTYDVRPLSEIKEALSQSAAIDYKVSSNETRDDLGWLNHGRYGTVQKNTIKDLENDEYPQIREQLPNFTYLYDAVFIKDEESYISYSPSNTAYHVDVSRGSATNKKVYSGDIKIKIPTGLKIFENSEANDDIYLVSDDLTTADGRKVIPVIYICPVNEFRYSFDLQETAAGLGAEDPEDATIYAQDVAQWCANYIKGTCMDEPIGTASDINQDRDQYWMETVQKWIIPSGDGTLATQPVGGWREFPGRPRAASSYSEAIIDEDTFDEVLAIAGKPGVITYQNFIRKLRIDMSCIKWIKNPVSEQAVEEQKKVLPLMKTNLRLVIIHNHYSNRQK